MDLETQVQNYDWGKRGIASYVAQLVQAKNANKEIYENIPYAELWMGTHPNGPSKVTKLNIELSDYIKQNSECLGREVLNTFGNKLPYLFKVLSVSKALSIQAHPNKELAKVLSISQPELYKDDNHKPELAIALTTFEALCGFRPFKEIKIFLQNVPELVALIGEQNVTKFMTSDEAGLSKELKNCFKSLMTQNTELIISQLQLLLSRISSLDESSRAMQLAPLVERLYDQFPNDVGCFVVYFLNYLKLSPDEALYLGPNEPHAYLSGDCVECMASSDNVVRAGLTPKFKDVETLCNMLTYQMETASAKIFKPIVENNFTELYAPPIKDFAVAKIKAAKNVQDMDLITRPSASIILVLMGNANSDNLSLLTKGTALFLEANKSLKLTNVSSDFTAFQAFANV